MTMPDNRSKDKSKYKRTNLFLLRVWCDDADENKDEQEDEQENQNGDEGESSTCRRWHGMVQRTVSGEAHSFGAKDDLIEVLEAMLYKDRKDHKDRPERLQNTGPRPQGKTSSEDSIAASGNNQNQTEANERTR